MKVKLDKETINDIKSNFINFDLTGLDIELEEDLTEELNAQNVKLLKDKLQSHGIDTTLFFNIETYSKYKDTVSNELRDRYDEALIEFEKLETKFEVKGDFDKESMNTSYIVWGISKEKAIEFGLKLLQEAIIQSSIKDNKLYVVAYKNANNHNFERYDEIAETTNQVLVGKSKDELFNAECTKLDDNFYYSYNVFKEYQNDEVKQEFNSLTESLNEKIVKKGNKYQVQSMKGKNMGTYDTREEAEKRLKQIEYFKHLNEYYQTDKFEEGVAGYIKEDGTLIILDEYHGEEPELRDLGYVEFSNTHPEEDTCIRVYKEPTEKQYSKIEMIIEKYLEEEGYCKLEVWKNNRYVFYKVYSLYDNACDDCSWEENVGNWTGRKLVNILKRYFNNTLTEELIRRDEILSKIAGLGYNIDFRKEGWYDEYSYEPTDLEKYDESDELPDNFYVENVYLPKAYLVTNKDNSVRFNFDIDEDKKIFKILLLWKTASAKKGEATKLVEDCLKELTDEWTVEIKDNINKEYWSHLADKYKNLKFEDVYESLNEEILKAESFDVKVTESPFEVKDILLKSKEPMRVYIDLTQGIYLIGNAYDTTHSLMVEVAQRNGYNLKWDDFDVKKGCLLYSPKCVVTGIDGDEYNDYLMSWEEAYEDDYDYFYFYDDFAIYTRYHSFPNYKELYSVFGKCTDAKGRFWNYDPFKEDYKCSAKCYNINESLSNEEQTQKEEVDRQKFNSVDELDEIIHNQIESITPQNTIIDVKEDYMDYLSKSIGQQTKKYRTNYSNITLDNADDLLGEEDNVWKSKKTGNKYKIETFHNRDNIAVKVLRLDNKGKKAVCIQYLPEFVNGNVILDYSFLSDIIGNYENYSNALDNEIIKVINDANDKGIDIPRKYRALNYEKVSSKKYELAELNKYLNSLSNNEDINEDLTDDEQTQKEEVEKLINDLYTLRQESIKKDGEFGIGNLVFKEFRNLDMLDNLKDKLTELESKNLSLESLDEDVYDADGYYNPSQDTKYKSILRKPINKLTRDEIAYVFTIHLTKFSNGYYNNGKQITYWYDGLVGWDYDFYKGLDIIKNEHKEDFDKAYNFFSNLKFPLKVYRALRENENEPSGKNHSLSWTTDINIYKKPNSIFRNCNKIVEATITTDMIQNEWTICNYIYYSCDHNYGRYPESEITLKPMYKTSKLNNLHFINKDEIEESLEEKIIYRGESDHNYSKIYPVYAGKFFHTEEDNKWITSIEEDEYGTLVKYDLDDNAKIFKGTSSEIYCSKHNELWNRKDMMLTKILNSANEPYRKGSNDIKEPLSLNEIFEKELADDTDNADVIFALTQYMAKKDLEQRGYDGAKWSNEDDLCPNQYQIWNLDVVKRLEESLENLNENVNEDLTSKEEVLNELDDVFGQEDVYMWSTFVLPNGHFLNPDNGDSYWKDIDSEPDYEHSDFIYYEYNSYYEDLFKDCIKMNVNFPYVILPQKLTREQQNALREIFNHSEQLMMNNFEDALAEWANVSEDKIASMKRPLIIDTPFDTTVVDLALYSTNDLMKLVNTAYSRGAFDNLYENLDKHLNESNYGYHAGDLGKAETRERQTGGRGSGHFGTGTYFVGDEEKIKNYNDYQYNKGKAPHYIVDFSSYNLYKPSTNDFGYKLHDALKIINNDYKYFSKYGEDIDWLISHNINAEHSDEFKTKDIPEIVSRLNNLLYDKIELSDEIDWSTIEQEEENASDEIYDELKPIYQDNYYKLWNAINDELYKTSKFKEFHRIIKQVIESIENVLDWRTLADYKNFKKLEDKLYDSLERKHSKEEIKKALQEVNKHLDDKTGDSLSTIFMKALGYEGVDVRHLQDDGSSGGLDNTAYGSVIYDVRPETVVEHLTEAKAQFLGGDYEYNSIHDYLEDEYGFSNDINTKSSSQLIDKEGKFLQSSKTHGTILMNMLQDEIIQVDNEDKLAKWNLVGTDLFENLGFVRLNNDVMNYIYLQLPSELTDKQIESIQKWADKYLLTSHNLIDISGIKTFAKFYMNRYDIEDSSTGLYSGNVDDLIKLIKRYKHTKKLRESIENIDIKLSDVVNEFKLTDKPLESDATYLLRNGKFMDTQGHYNNHQHINVAKFIFEKTGKKDNYMDGSVFMLKNNAVRITTWIPAFVLPSRRLSEEQEESLMDIILKMNISRDKPLMITDYKGTQQAEFYNKNLEDIFDSIDNYYRTGIL